MANAPFTSYLSQKADSGTIREDLIDIMTDLSPDSTPLMTMLGRSTASNTIHEWPEDYQDRPTSVSTVAEGADASSGAAVIVARRTNYTGIITKVVSVSDTAKAIDFAGQSDAFAYQKQRGLTTWKLNAEFMMVRGSASSGASGTARQSAGLNTVITTVCTLASGISLSETAFNDIAQASWGKVGDQLFDLVLAPGYVKRKISEFTAGSTKYVDATDKKLVRPVQVYESDFGVHKIMAHPDVISTATSLHLLMIKEDNYKIAWLRPIVWQDLAKSGDYEWGQYVGELCLEHRSERASAKIYGFL